MGLQTPYTMGGHFFASNITFFVTSSASNASKLSNTAIALPFLLSVRDFCTKHTWAKPGTLRMWIFNEHSNGFTSCILSDLMGILS